MWQSTQFLITSFYTYCLTPQERPALNIKTFFLLAKLFLKQAFSDISSVCLSVCKEKRDSLRKELREILYLWYLQKLSCTLCCSLQSDSNSSCLLKAVFIVSGLVRHVKVQNCNCRVRYHRLVRHVKVQNCNCRVRYHRLVRHVKVQNCNCRVRYHRLVRK